jgi:hypothetical protein
MAFKGLFIGIDRYDSPEINWLSCANRDAKALHALFTDTLGGETMLLTDEQATVAAIRERFEQTPTVTLTMLWSSPFRDTAPRRMNLSGMIPTLTTSQEQRFR